MNHRDLLGFFRSSHRKCSVKKGVLRKFGNFKGKTPVLESLLKCFFNISIIIPIKFLTLRSFEIFYFTPGKLGRYDVA